MYKYLRQILYEAVVTTNDIDKISETTPGQ